MCFSMSTICLIHWVRDRHPYMILYIKIFLSKFHMIIKPHIWFMWFYFTAYFFYIICHHLPPVHFYLMFFYKKRIQIKMTLMILYYKGNFQNNRKSLTKLAEARTWYKNVNKLFLTFLIIFIYLFKHTVLFITNCFCFNITDTDRLNYPLF